MRLFEIDQHIRKVSEMGFSVNEETGELIFDETDLNELQMEREQKLLSIAKIIKEKKAFEDALKNEKKSLDERIKQVGNEAKRLENYLLSSIKEGEKLEDAQAKISYSKGSESVQILGDVPSEFLRIKTTEEPDKTKIKNALKEGQVFNFAELIRNPRVSIK